MKTIMYAQRVEGWRERWARHKYYLMDLNRTNNAWTYVDNDAFKTVVHVFCPFKDPSIFSGGTKQSFVLKYRFFISILRVDPSILGVGPPANRPDELIS